MEVVTLLLYVGAVWVAGAIALFVWNVASHGHEHADRLAVLPLEDNWSDPIRPDSTVPPHSSPKQGTP
jgi:hypothetical protein